MSKIITVFGATGNQGGSVIAHLLADKQLSSEFKIRGITRDTSKPAAKALADKGVETVSADLNSDSSVAEAIKGSHTVFLVTNYWETAQAAVEIAQGKRVADASKEAGVSHLIFSSLINVNDASGGRLSKVPHFDGKADIEKYIRASGIPRSTFVLPGYFMSNLLGFIRKGDDGVWSLAFPFDEDAGQIPLFDAQEDTGKFVKAALKNPDAFNGKQILEAADYYTASRILAELEEVAGVKTRFAKVTDEQYVSFLPEAIAEEMLENHLLLVEPGYYAGADLKESLGFLEGEKPVSWKEFITKSGHFK